MSHALYAPSSAARTVACLGSVRLCAMYPQEDTIEAMDGTATHWAAAEILSGRDVCLGQVAPNGVVLTDEMIEVAELYSTHIIARGNGQVGNVELPVINDFFHVHNWGTPDHDFFDPLTMTLYVDDLKNGHGYVSHIRNWQMINYVGLILKRMGVDGIADQKIRVVMTIFQPRNYHRLGPIRSEVRMAVDMRADFNILRMAFERADDPNAPCIASDECEHCPGRHACEAATAAGWNAAEHAYSSVPLNMSPEAMSLELRILRKAGKRLTARISGLEEQIRSTIKRGAIVPGFKFEHGVGRTVWKDIQEAGALGDMLGVNLRKAALITPLQAIKAGVPKEMVDEYSHAPRSAAELVEIDADEVSRIFSNV